MTKNPEVSIQNSAKPTTSFTQLKVWQAAHKATLAVYDATRSFPQDERFGLTVQMRRAAVSIAANIAEGFGRRHPQDKNRFYTMSMGSLQELRCYLILSKDLGYSQGLEPIAGLLEEVARMLTRLSQVVHRGSAP